MNRNEMTQQEYRGKLADVAALAVNYAKTGRGYFTMRNAFNDLAEKCGANRTMTDEDAIGRRKILAQSVSAQCITPLTKEANNRLQGELSEIAEDYHPRRFMHR